MSSETYSEGLPHMRCEAVTPNMRPTTLDCHRPHDALLRTRSALTDQSPTDDPAVAIGFALGHVRTQDGLTGTVPPRVMAHLLVHIERGDPACEVVMDWLTKRGRNAAVQIQRRRVRERPRRNQAVSGNTRCGRDALADPTWQLLPRLRRARSMSKIARLLVHRLEQLARREARRNALRNGLLDVKAIEIGGHMIRRNMPVFDTSSLTGDRDKDLAWVRRHFGDYLQPTAGAFEGTSASAGLRSESRRRSGSKGERLSDADHASRAYALSLIGQAGKAPLVSNIIAAIVLARTIERARVTLAAVTRAAAMPAPVIALHAPINGFESAIRRLIEVPGFVPGGDLKGLDGEYVYDDMTIAGDEGPGRTYVLLLGHLLRRVAGGNLQRRLLNALRRDYPVVAICEDAKGVPDEISIAADIKLEGGRLDYPFLVLMLEAVYGPSGRLPLDRWTNSYDVHYLTIDDVVLAFRPGRSAAEVVAILASLTERNRIAARDGENDDDDSDGSSTGSKTSKQKPGKASHDTPASGQDSSSGGWRRDKPSGAEVIQPEPWNEDGSPPNLTVETLPGYGKAKTWALDLKADLDDYRASILPWSDMSTKLLLSGPPGTGKTTFARALCNSLQVPLVVSSVSTWLQGAHLSDVLNRMARTFAEARATAPAILFIDEIDGIGKRQPAERDYSDYWNSVVNKALELLDGAVKGEGLIVVGATNRPEQIDEALKRSGRLETHIEIPRPDTATLAEIFRHHLGEDLKVLVVEGQVPTKEEPEIPKPSQDAEDSLSQQAALNGGSQ